MDDKHREGPRASVLTGQAGRASVTKLPAQAWQKEPEGEEMHFR